MRTEIWAGVAAIAASSCIGDDSIGVLEASAAAVPVISAVTDAGSFWGSHYVTLWGTFPTDSSGCAIQPVWERGTSLSPSTGCYAVDIQCNGALIQPVVITGYSATSFINVAFPDRPTGSRCTARVKRSLQSDTAVGGGGVKVSNESWPGNVFPGPPTPIGVLQPPPLETVGTVDRGITAGLHYYELYGRYPTAPGATDDHRNFTAVIRCDGAFVYVGPVAGGAPPGQINVSFPDPAPVSSRSCTFEVRRNQDLAQSPRWYQRVNGQDPPINARIGAYFWGGFQPARDQLGDAPRNGVVRLRDAGIVGPVRLAMGPKQRGNPSMGNPPSYNVYNIDFSPCPVGSQPGTPQNVPAPFLPCAVNLPAFQRAFDAVSATTKIIITAMDSTSSGDNETELRRFVNKTWMETPANYARVRSEYQAMAENLLLSRHGKPNGKTFIIANWEGDNLLYCGGVYAVMKHGDFSACPGGVNEDFGFAKDGLVAWMRARRDGIALAKAAHPTITDVRVDDGVEFAVFGLVKECGGNTPCPARPDVLHDVVPAVRPRYALYSAWESVGNGRLDEDLRAITGFLAPYGTTNIVGEWGAPGFDDINGAQSVQTWLLKENTKAILRSSFDSATTWHGFPVIDQMDYLLSHDGDEMTAGMTALRAGALPPPPTSPLIQIVALDETSRANNRRYFELWGGFRTGHDYIPKVKCNNDSVFDGVQEYRSAGQVNISIPDSHADQWCVLHLVDATNPAVRSNDIGPFHTCWGQPCPKYW